MALFSGSNAANGEERLMVEEPSEGGRAFDMFPLMAHLPRKRKGLSVYFAGKSRSFGCMIEAKSVGDLEKPAPEISEAKRRKYAARRRSTVLDPVPWREAAGGDVGVAGF